MKNDVPLRERRILNEEKTITFFSESMSQSGSESQSNYKFKSCIRQRFSANCSRTSFQRDSESGSSNSSCSSAESTPSTTQRRSRSNFLPSEAPTAPNTPAMEEADNSSGYHSTGSRRRSPPGSFGVPIFALHCSGAYYIPLLLDAILISRHPLFVATDDKESVHPISISAKLCSAGLTESFITLPENSNGVSHLCKDISA